MSSLGRKFSCPLFANPWMKKARCPRRNATITRNPPDRPYPCRAMRCLMTPPPRSAPIRPFAARSTASHSTPSAMPSRTAKRPNGLVQNVRNSSPVRLCHHAGGYSTVCHTTQSPDTNAPRPRPAGLIPRYLVRFSRRCPFSSRISRKQRARRLSADYSSTHGASKSLPKPATPTFSPLASASAMAAGAAPTTAFAACFEILASPAPRPATSFLFTASLPDHGNGRDPHGIVPPPSGRRRSNRRTISNAAG